MVIKKAPYGAIKILNKISNAYYRVRLLDDCSIFKKGTIHQMFLTESELKPITCEQLSLFKE